MNEPTYRHEYIEERCRTRMQEIRWGGDQRKEDAVYEEAYDLATIEADLLAIPGAPGEDGPQPLYVEKELNDISPDRFRSNPALLECAISLELLSRGHTVNKERLSPELRVLHARAIETGELYREQTLEALRTELHRLLDETPGV